LYHRSSTGSLNKAKILGVIGSRDDAMKFLKETDIIGGTPIDTKSIHLIHELSSNNINKMPSIIEDRTEEGSDTEDMKMLMKKESKKKGDKLSKLTIGNNGEETVEESSKKDDGDYTSYSPFSTNYELWKNPIIENLPYRSGGAPSLGSHRNSICCPYDIFTSFCASNNVRRGSLPALNYSYTNANNPTTNDFATPPHSSSTSMSYSSTSSSASSSLSSPSSNSTMVNQSNSNDPNAYNLNKLSFNGAKNQKGGFTQVSSSSTPSTKGTDASKGNVFISLFYKKFL